MSPIYVPGKVTFRQTYVGTDDPDAAAYIAAVEAADEIASPGIGGLETATKVAIHSFVKGCKNDGIWPAIKASCILAGARTTNGALVPLVGTDPTSYDFDLIGNTDYNRKTGLKGNASTKYLDTGYNAQSQPLNNAHVGVHITEASTLSSTAFGAGSTGTGVTNWSSAGNIRFQSAAFIAQILYSNGFIGLSREASAEISVRTGSATSLESLASDGRVNENYNIFRRGNASPNASNARIAFYSIGESLPDSPTKTGLQLLDERVSALITAFGVAIP
jgi:hypothetical protein